MIERLRADFLLAAKAEGWASVEQAEIGAEVKAAIGANDTEALAYWAKQFADSAAAWRAWCERVRQAEARIHAAAEAKRKEEA